MRFRTVTAVRLAALTGFAISAVGGEWVYDAHRIGLVPVPSRLFSVGLWASIVIVAATITILGGDWLPRHGLRALGLTASLTGYAAATALSVVVALSRYGFSGAFPDLQILALACAPLAVVILISADSNARLGLFFVLAITVALSIYALIQLGTMTTGIHNPWFVVGSENRWWDSRAVFGTFATTGDHTFADAMVLLGASLLPWAIWGELSRRHSLMLGALYAIVVALVVLSLARAAILSLVCAAVVTFLGRRELKAVIPILAAAVVAVLLIPETRSALAVVYERGIIDTGAQYRFQIWSALAAHARWDWLIGEGANSIGMVTRSIGIVIPHAGDQTLGPTTDNLYLRRAIEGGVLGIVTILAVIVGSIWESTKPSATNEGLVWRHVVRAIAVALAIQSLTSDTIALPQLGAVFAYCLGVAGAGLIRENNRRAPDPVSESVDTAAVSDGQE